MATKFTFKTEKPTGKYASFQSANHIIKLDGKQVGTIDDKAPFTIRLMVIKNDLLEDGNKNCIWKWITLAKISENLDDAKKFVNDSFITLNKKYKLYQLKS